ncbi:MAG: GNAT family N-acetyltransferase [Ruminococcus sp.]|nr:GNAT family N-acetyltransferase [Ruminococcus sp.]
MREIQTERLRLRPVGREDIKRIFTCWASDPKVTKYLTWNPHHTLHDTETVMDIWLEEYKKPDCYRYGIERRITGDLIGMIDVVGFHHGAPVIGYCSGRAYWGRGYMTEALKAVTARLFEDGYDTIVIEAVEQNIGSNRVIEKAGFEKVADRVAPLSENKKDMLVKINSYRLHKPKSDT